MACERFDSTETTFDSTGITFDSVCIESGVLNLSGAGTSEYYSIFISNAICRLDGNGILHVIPDQGVLGSVSFLGSGNVSVSSQAEKIFSLLFGANGTIAFRAGLNKDSSVVLNGEGVIRLYPGKYITGSVGFNGEGTLEFRRQGELVVRGSHIDLWAEYELMKISAITDLVSFGENTVTLSMKLQSQIK